MSLAPPARPLALPRPRPLAAGGLLGACLLTAAPAALAQAALPVAAASAPVQALTAEQLQAERRRAQAAGEPAGYQDRYLDAAELGALTQQAEAEAAADDGAPRAWLVETPLGLARDIPMDDFGPWGEGGPAARRQDVQSWALARQPAGQPGARRRAQRRRAGAVAGG